MTAGATRFVGPLTFSALASEPVRTSLWDERRSRYPHTRLGPVGRRDRGGAGHRPADRRLRGRDLVGPAHRHPAGHPGAGAAVPGHAHRDVGAPGRAATTWRCCAGAGCTSSSRPSGRLAGGDVGSGPPGRSGRHRGGGGRAPVAGRRSGVGSGPGPGRDQRPWSPRAATASPIDPVRYIGNRSSGKQGYAVAAELAGAGRRGHPGQHRTADLARPAGRTEVVSVETAAEMAAAVLAAQPALTSS